MGTAMRSIWSWLLKWQNILRFQSATQKRLFRILPILSASVGIFMRATTVYRSLSRIITVRHFPPPWIGRSRFAFCEICRKMTFSLLASELIYHQQNKLGCRLVALSAKIGLFCGAFINDLRRRNRPQSSMNTTIVL